VRCAPIAAPGKVGAQHCGCQLVQHVISRSVIMGGDNNAT
jgi:hypothetical protein